MLVALYAIRGLARSSRVDAELVRRLDPDRDAHRIRSIVQGRWDDVDFCETMIEVDPSIAVEMIKGHSENVVFCRLREKVERYRALGDDPLDTRLDYSTEAYRRLLTVSEDLAARFPDDFRLHDRLAKNYAAGGYRDRARRHFSRSLKLQREQGLERRRWGLVTLVTMPRSGSGFVSRSLVKGLGLEDLTGQIRYIDEWFPDFGVFAYPDYNASNEFVPMPDGIVVGHSAALEPNLWNLSLTTDRLVVNFRDPRQALVSWVHYMEYLRRSGNVNGLLQYRLPDGYFELSFHDQVEWQIESYFVPVNVEWIRGWVSADESPDFPCDVLFTKFEDLADDPHEYFARILSFFGIPDDAFEYPEVPEFRRGTHLRKGSVDEWKQALSSKQIEKVNQTIPGELFERFGWPT